MLIISELDKKMDINLQSVCQAWCQDFNVGWASYLLSYVNNGLLLTVSSLL